MDSNNRNILWPAAPHTIAKIRILEAYLVAWFQILGTSKYRIKQDLVYIDGFAGPGKYTNFDRGSPLAALAAGKKALSNIRWMAGRIHCCFIEERKDRAQSLERLMKPYMDDERLNVLLYNDTFSNGLERLRTEHRSLLTNNWPLFAFIDPCGATGVPLADVTGLLRKPTAEVLLNFDADGIARIYRAADKAGHSGILNSIYTDQSWVERFQKPSSFDSLCRESLELYKEKLNSIERVKYVFPFEMRTRSNSINYFLLFASQHPLGLEKMKEAMRTVDQSGEYCFSDARVGQNSLFRFDDPRTYAKEMLSRFAGKTVQYDTLKDYALLCTPFINPKSMLKELLENEEFWVKSTENRRKGTFNEEKIVSITFRG